MDSRKLCKYTILILTSDMQEAMRVLTSDGHCATKKDYYNKIIK